MKTVAQLEQDGDLDGLLKVRIEVDTEIGWAAAGRKAAEDLFASHLIARELREPGRCVFLLANVYQVTEGLKEAAIAAFNARWAQLVPGWKAP